MSVGMPKLVKVTQSMVELLRFEEFKHGAFDLER